MSTDVAHRPPPMIGASPAMQRVHALIARVGPSHATVLISGESGVGKELVADAIHASSPRARGPLIKVNCAALPGALLESELFGHEQGAFTDALRQRPGRFERAHGGTIFLDEVGDLPASTQILLLRVLQERCFERVGGTSTVAVDVRLIAATHRDLRALIAQGRFREDLFYRLAVVPIVVPPLRARGADIALLARFFVERYARAAGKRVCRIGPAALEWLQAHFWPGNVRELEHCIERAVLLCDEIDDGVIQAQHVWPAGPTHEGLTAGLGLQATLDRVERELLVAALQRTRGNLAAAARLLEISERVMGLRVKKHALDPRRFR